MDTVSEQVTVDYAKAQAWKQRADAAAKAERLARQATKAALSAVKAAGIPQLAEKARLASEEATQAARDAEKVWADTAAALRKEQ